jgi:multidrug efflux pump
MNISEPFINRPIATTLLTLAIALAGAMAFRVLPVSPLPQVDFPTISVAASLPGASPETMAGAVATPLERQFTRIAGVTEMTSSSFLGTTSITLQFDLSRNIDAAARDVEAAINAARGQLPTNLPSNPSYRKVNPADSPILILSLTSDTLGKGRMYDAASTILQQKLSQVDGVGQVSVGGSSLPAVRVEVNPTALNKYGIGLEGMRTALAAANSNLAKGQFSTGDRTWDIDSNDQLHLASEYQQLIVSYHQGAPVRVSDVAEVLDSVEDVRNAGFTNGTPCVLLIVFRQPGVNIIETVDRVRALLPQLQASIPQAIKLSVVLDQTVTIRASVHDVERTLLISIGLVILVVFLFLRNFRAMLIPGVVVPVSLIGTFGAMYLLNYSIDNLSLMAMTIATGFVVDDAIVVVENVTRYLEKGLSPLEAARVGAAEIGFTVFSISVSLVAVFIPILLMGGLVGRLFREFAVTLTIAIVVSMVVSLTTTPMMCAKLLKRPEDEKHGRLYHLSERFFNGILHWYEVTLAVALRHSVITFVVAILAVALNVYLFIHVPKGFFPQQDTGRMSGNMQSDQATSFQTMQTRLAQMIAIVKSDPAVDNVIGFTGGGGGTTINSARMFISLKPLDQRRISADGIIARLRPKFSKFSGATLYLQAMQDVRVGGRSSAAQYQFTLQSDNIKDLDDWAPRLLQEMRKIPILTDVNTDQQDNGQQAYLDYDRDTAARFGISSRVLDNTLYDAFGQRQVSTMYSNLNQYHVVMEVAPEFWQDPQSLRDIYVASDQGQQVPLSALTTYHPSTAPMSVNHQGQFPSVTISFNLPLGIALGQAVDAIQQSSAKIGLPANVMGTFQGTAQAYQAALANEPVLIALALATVYIVLGILYESFIHPITILSTLPSAGIGALLALLLFKIELDLIAIIGIILLIGIVKKNAILMIDFALATQRSHGKSPADAIYEACLLRFRPILMTTLAALFGALPLAFGSGTGSELRRPLGVAIIGGLIVSQVLTLYTTPVIYIYLDRFRLWIERRRQGGYKLGEKNIMAV